MIEDQVLFHLPKFGGNIFSLRNFPDPLKGHDEAVPQGAGFGSLKSVSTQGMSTVCRYPLWVPSVLTFRLYGWGTGVFGSGCNPAVFQQKYYDGFPTD